MGYEKISHKKYIYICIHTQTHIYTHHDPIFIKLKIMQTQNLR